MVVIGCGPAGSSFARIAAQQGLEVVVVDKRKEIGVPVRCGEALGVSEPAKEGLSIPKYAISLEVEGAKLISPSGHAVYWKGEETRGYVLERKFFDKWLGELAAQKGAKIMAYTHAVDIIKEGGKVVGVKASHGGREPFEIRAKVIVSAEGMEALIARKMGFKSYHPLHEVDTCYEYEMAPYEHENVIELYFGNKIAPRGYVWIFPKANKKANVGIGIGGNVINAKKWGGTEGADPKKLLDEFIEKNEQLREASTFLDFGGVISVGEPLKELVRDNCMVIGTAAKQVDPIHGGGIALAMEAGVMAANYAEEAVKKGPSALKKYEKEWWERKGQQLKRRHLLRKVMERLGDDDLDYIFQQLNHEALLNIMNNNFAPVAMKVIAGRPSLLKVLGALMG